MAPAVSAAREAAWTARLHDASAGALYLHVPFCARKCAYCDFASSATLRDAPLMGAYLDALGRLLAEASGAGILDGCATAYVGGGTPTLAGAALPRLVERVRVSAAQLAELTVEANPDSLSDALLRDLPAAGCTRLSMGVQSLDDGELALLGRIHTAGQARERLDVACGSGLSVSCDLMCATPGQTDESWVRTLRGVVETGVGHVSVYPLQIEEGTPFDERYGDHEPAWADPAVQAARMEEAERLLAAAGFARYEVASHALPGRACRHNQAYWTAVGYLGLGTSAASMLTREAYLRLRELVPRLPAPAGDVSRVRLSCTSGPGEVAAARGLSDLRFEGEMLDEAQAAAEDLMLAMRMVRGAGPGLLAHARSVLGADAVDEALAWCRLRGLARAEGPSWVPTHEGWLLGNELYGRLWDLAPSSPRALEA